jgi:hypothetical protein
MTDSTPVSWFAIVVDNELAHLHSVENSLEGAVAAFSSNPTIVPISQEEFDRIIAVNMPYGSVTYDGTNFIVPE